MPDSVDRLNKDSYQIINVGSMRMVFINLEYDMPQYTLDWAQDVINAQMHDRPEHRVHPGHPQLREHQ